MFGVSKLGGLDTTIRRVAHPFSDSNWDKSGNSGDSSVMPVRLPPGFSILVTKPKATGSAAIVNTIGTLLVTCFAARVAGAGGEKITSTFYSTRSLTSCPNRSFLPSELRYSKMVLPGLEWVTSRTTKPTLGSEGIDSGAGRRYMAAYILPLRQDAGVAPHAISRSFSASSGSLAGPQRPWGP